MGDIVSLDSLTAEQRERIKKLTTAPTLATPTVLMWAVLTASYLASDTLAVQGRIPLWAGMLINSAVGYMAFSVAHDALHRAISTNVRLNDVLGQLAIFLVAPYIDMRLFRWAHILHHRFANGPRDPDSLLRGPWWSLPFHWAFFDVIYFVFAIRHADKISRRYVRANLLLVPPVALIIATLTYYGFGEAILALWLIPSRIIFVALGFMFFWLPHVPHDAEQEVNFTRASTVRQGLEWILNPVMQYQNYHLIHHIYPTTPFYNNYKVWREIEPELRKKQLAVQYNLAIYPVILPPLPALSDQGSS
jgi:beta-carotene hydroxylase